MPLAFNRLPFAFLIKRADGSEALNLPADAGVVNVRDALKRAAEAEKVDVAKYQLRPANGDVLDNDADIDESWLPLAFYRLPFAFLIKRAEATEGNKC